MEPNGFFKRKTEWSKSQKSGSVGACVGLGLALALSIFGLWKTLFIMVMTLLGYWVGAQVFKGQENLRSFIDRLFPTGRFR